MNDKVCAAARLTIHIALAVALCAVPCVLAGSAGRAAAEAPGSQAAPQTRVAQGAKTPGAEPEAPAEEETGPETPRPDMPAPKSAVKEKQYVYGLTLWDGATFRGTFAPKAIDTIYMLADADNVVSAKETEVYWWAITSEWYADWFSMDNDVPATLVVTRGSEEVARLEPTEFVLEFPEGYLSDKAVLWKAEDAKRVSDDYQKERDAFFKQVADYYEARYRYEQALAEFMKNPKGKAVPKEPEQPVPPTRAVGEIQKGFVVKLPVGRYRVKALDKDGKPLPGLTKNLVVFTHRRTGVGYEMIPEEKWTYPDKMDDVRQVVYYAVPGVMFLKAFDEKEYNAHDYAKLTELSKPFSGQGLEFSWTWVHLDPIERKGHKIRLECSQPLVEGGGPGDQGAKQESGSGPSRVVDVPEKPYYVKQRTGSALGYDIIELPENDPENRQPSFWAYRIQPPARGWARLVLLDDKGKPIPGSERVLRKVVREPSGKLLWAPLLPILAWAAVFAVRRLSTTGRGGGRARGV